jgi:hypothetical protein
MTEIRHNEITMPLPPGWRNETKDELLVIVAEEDGGFRPNIVLSRDRSRGETAEAFADRYLPNLRAALADYELLAEGPVDLGPHSGFMREHGFTANDQYLQQLQFYVVRGETAYTMTFTHVATRFPAMRSTAEELFGTARFD